MERIDIANIALSMLGVDQITSLDDESNTAEQVKLHYIPARDATLEAHEWSFAIERFEPALLTAAPLFGAANQFSIPVNILRVLTCDNPTTVENPGYVQPINSTPQIDWVLEGRSILCNEDIVYARGIRRVEEEGIFSNLFVQAFAAKLAMLLAINLTASADIQARVTAYYTFAMHEAKSRDGLQGRSKQLRNKQLQYSR